MNSIKHELKTGNMKIREANNFAPIQLDEMDQVKLMNRIDTKYWFHKSNLPVLLPQVYPFYFVLNINGEVALPYATTYYDTDTNSMFTAHHNGKLNRYKIRRRSYVISGLSFLEVKFKNNKKRTIKKRISTLSSETEFSDIENSFIQSTTPFSKEDLSPSLVNNFSRITLVSKNFNERCTIDFMLSFKSKKTTITLDNLVIVEIKSNGKPSASPLAKTLRDQRIKASGFSKYCIGRTITEHSIKRNAFKHKVKMLENTLDTPGLYNF
ncbi:polyphosphate polymerase domain-containing protein [Prolixibacteraceae bacterium JC049]|nr:polyphosphate polymerase domain-containing protein [Prolixibacteraceae bacterium JC049]